MSLRVAWSTETAALARKHNNAQVISSEPGCLGLTVLGLIDFGLEHARQLRTPRLSGSAAARIAQPVGLAGRTGPDLGPRFADRAAESPSVGTRATSVAVGDGL